MSLLQVVGPGGETISWRKPRDSDSGYVYLVNGVNTDLFKIGHTNNLGRRVGEISPLLPFPLRLVGSIKSDSRRHAEKFLHEYFNALRIRGEWFVSPDFGIVEEFLHLGPRLDVYDLQICAALAREAAQ